MSTSPIRKAAGQSVEEMTAQLAGSKEGNRLYTPKAGTYKEVSDALKAEALDAAIAALSINADNDTGGKKAWQGKPKRCGRGGSNRHRLHDLMQAGRGLPHNAGFCRCLRLFPESNL